MKRFAEVSKKTGPGLRRGFSLSALVLFSLLLAVPAAADTQWMRYDSQHFGVFFPRDEVRSATAFAKSAEALREEVVRTLPGDFDAKVLVYLAPDRETYESLQPGRNVPTWSVGVAYPKKRTIIMFSPTGALREGLHGSTARTFVHELSHVALFEILGRRHPPRWLDEGVAQMVAQEWSSYDSVRLTAAVLFDGLIPLSELTTRWPKTGSRAKLAYAVSLSLVIYLKHKRRLKPLIAALAEGQSSSRALHSATGLSLSGLQKRWRRYLERRHTWLTILNRSCIWSGMSLLAIISWIIFRLRQRRRYEALDDDMPAYRDKRLDEPKKLRRLRTVKKDDRWPGPH